MSDDSKMQGREDTDRLNKTRELKVDNTDKTAENKRSDSAGEDTPRRTKRVSKVPPPPRSQFARRDRVLRERKRSSNGLLPPWWAFLLMLLFVAGAVFGVLLLVIALGGRDPIQTEPQLIIYTAQPEQLAQSSVTVLETATLPPQFAPTNLQPQSTFMMVGPTLPPPQITATPEIIEIGKTIFVIDVGDQQLNVRDRPGIQTNVIFRAPESDTFIITDGPVQADGLTWWRIQDPANGARAGWAASNYLQPVPSLQEGS